MNPVLRYLDRRKIEYKEFKHPPVHTVEESKSLKSEIPGMHCKALFLKSTDSFYLIAMKADKRLNTKILKNYFKLKKLNFASPSDLKKILNVKPGSVSLFSIINSKDSILILDEEVYNSQESGFHPNINTSTLVLKKENLRKFYNSVKNEKHTIKL